MKSDLTTKAGKGADAVSPASFSEVSKVFLGLLAPRTRDIVSARFGLSGGRQKTLEEIGKEYGITRERVRQILGNAFSSVKQKREDPLFVEVSDRIESALAEHSGIMEVSGLFALLSGDSKTESGALHFFLECMRSVKEERETKDRARSFVLSTFDPEAWKKTISVASTVLQEADGILSEDALYSLAKKKGVSVDKKTFFDHLAVSLRIRKNPFGQWGFADSGEIRPRGTREKAYLILKMEGVPLHFKAIAERIDSAGLQKNGKSTHPQTVHNELIKDRKFVLVGRGLYALSEWGYKRGTVREVLEDILSKSRTPMKRTDILDEVFKTRKVKRSTVVINLNAFFEKVGKDEYTVKKR